MAIPNQEQCVGEFLPVSLLVAVNAATDDAADYSIPRSSNEDDVSLIWFYRKNRDMDENGFWIFEKDEYDQAIAAIIAHKTIPSDSGSAITDKNITHQWRHLVLGCVAKLWTDIKTTTKSTEWASNAELQALATLTRSAVRSDRPTLFNDSSEVLVELVIKLYAYFDALPIVKAFSNPATTFRILDEIQGVRGKR